MRLNSSMKPISTTRSPVSGSRPVVSVSSTISRIERSGPRITAPARHSSNGAQNAMDLRPRGIEAARAIHHEMRSAAFFLVGRLLGEDRVELALAHVGAGEHALALQLGGGRDHHHGVDPILRADPERQRAVETHDT